MAEIFGTLGPACRETCVLEEMFREGMDGIRLNMSHSGLRESEPLIYSFHQAARRAGVKPELLIDMQGPELRIGDCRDGFLLGEGERVRLTDWEADPDLSEISVPGSVLEVLQKGDRILLDDGRLELEVTDSGPETGARVIRGGLLESRKSLKIVDKSLASPAVTKQDRENIRLAKDYGVTALMQPFVTRASDLQEVREELGGNQIDDIRVFAKIENRQGVQNIREILPFADMIVIARGDLGNDMPLWKLPLVQKELAQICREEKKPFMVVTQMLASMVQNPVPTRAEVSDIFHAVADGASAVMVTNETAAGKYPAEAIRYLKRTADEAERWKKKHRESSFLQSERL